MNRPTNKMNRPTNKQIVNALKNIKRRHLVRENETFSYYYLNDEKERFICYALSKLKDRDTADWIEENVINKRMESNYITLEEWITRRICGFMDRNLFHNLSFTNEGKAKMQEYRHAWVSQLIKEFSK